LKRAYLLLKKNGFTRNVLIVGNGGSGELLAAKLSFENPFGINVVGFIDEKIAKGEEIIGGKKVLGKICEINSVVNSNKINEIIIADDTSEYARIQGHTLNLLLIFSKSFPKKYLLRDMLKYL
jgi:FlaA1/EpsC-like NDP-sugar epimerase